MENDDEYWFGPCKNSLTWWYISHYIPIENIRKSCDLPSNAVFAFAKPDGYDEFFKAKIINNSKNGFIVNFNGIPSLLQEQKRKQIRLDIKNNRYYTLQENMYYFYEDDTSF